MESVNGAQPEAQSKSTAQAYNIRKATKEDGSTILELGRRVFIESFGNFISSNDLKTYLNEAYTLEAFERDLSAPTKHFWVAEARTSMPDSSTEPKDVKGLMKNPSAAGDGLNIAGYIQVHEGTTEDCLGPISDQAVEINRLYLRPETHGTGLAQTLMTTGETWAKVKGCERVWLGVWEHNAKAKRFYTKCGYGYVGKHQFKMGEQVDTDEVWVKQLV